MKRVRLLITGRVQGVWFRESTRVEAERFGVVGWVRNLEDGRVEAVIEGEDHRVDDLVAWCRHGPPRADVTGVVVRPEASTGAFETFMVRR